MITSKEVAENFPISAAELTSLANKTVSGRAFHYLVKQALKAKSSLSVVRMGDGERQLFIDCVTAQANKVGDTPVVSYTPDWRERMGITSITYNALVTRMSQSISETDWFSPNVNGLHSPDYSLYPWYKLLSNGQPLVDNFFVNDWTLDQRNELLKMSGNVLVIHRNPVTANTFARRARAYLNVGIRHVPMSNWAQAEAVVAECAKWDYPLALVSAGPASKWIIPEIAKQGKVVLDLGNAMDHWLLLELYKADPSKLSAK